MNSENLTRPPCSSDSDGMLRNILSIRKKKSIPAQEREARCVTHAHNMHGAAAGERAPVTSLAKYMVSSAAISLADKLKRRNRRSGDSTRAVWRHVTSSLGGFSSAAATPVLAHPSVALLRGHADGG